MDDRYYILENGDQTGPYSLEELIERAPDIHTRILSTSENTWQDACDLPELYEYFREQGVYFPTAENLASFWIRLAAFVVDFILLMFVFKFIVLVLTSRGLVDSKFFTSMDTFSKMPVKQVMTLQATVFLYLLLYNAICEASALQGSLGKKACGLIVVNADGERISFPNALARSLGKVVSLNFWGIGFISIFFTEHKQALHDYVAKTYVIRKNA